MLAAYFEHMHVRVLKSDMLLVRFEPGIAI